ncbi:MAG: LiaF-related protein [Gemmatimonadota bacterium]|nr:LiaF-related protein [Gemmatimonadota bacterium]
MRNEWLSRAGALTALIAASVGPIAAQDWRDFRAARQSADVESMQVELLYGAGRLFVKPSGSSFLYDARIRYDTERFQPLRGWTIEGDRGHLRLALTSVGDERGQATIRLEEWDLDFDFDDLRFRDDEAGELNLELHPDVPTDLRLEIGAAASRLDLGGLSLTSFELLTGASKTEVVFGDPNRERMSELVFKVGAAEFDASGLGNARFDRMEFVGAIGDVRLDFSGEWERSATAEIKMGVGELNLRVPREIGVRIERSSLLIALDAPGFTKVDRSYESENWNTAEIKLEIVLEAAFGAVEVERI